MSTFHKTTVYQTDLLGAQTLYIITVADIHLRVVDATTAYYCNCATSTTASDTDHGIL